jgi:hypothetical protein
MKEKGKRCQELERQWQKKVKRRRQVKRKREVKKEVQKRNLKMSR